MSRFANLFSGIRQSLFVRDVAKLSFGTLAGRLISFAILPLLTRLYSPDDFSVLATYLALLTTIAVAACLRFDIAVPLAQNEEEAVNLVTLALTALCAVTLMVTVVMLSAPQRIVGVLGNPAVEPYLLLVPLGVLLAGSYSIFQNWATRMRRFGQIARTRVTQSILGAMTSVSFGFAGLSPFGLLVGNALSIGAGGFSLALKGFRNDRARLEDISIGRMREAFKRNRRYPLFSTPESFLNIAGQQVPVLLVAAYAGAEAGFLLLAMQLMSAPMALLGSSISQVYVSRAPEALREGQLAKLTFSIVRKLLLVSVIPFALIAICSPFVVPFIFGDDWGRTGTIISWLVPWIMLQFLASPISMVMFVTGRQRGMLALTATGFLLRVGGVVSANVLALPLAEAFAVCSAMFYAICITVFIYAAKNASVSRAPIGGV